MELTIGVEGEILAARRPTGVERALRLWLEELPRIPGVRVRLFCRSLISCLPQGVEPLRLPSRLPLALWRELRLPGALLRSRVDVLLSPVAAFPLRSPVPVVATIHELPWLEPGCSCAHPRESLRARLALSRADAVLVPSASTARQCLRLAGMHGLRIRRLRVVRHGFRPLPAREAPLPPRARPPLLATISAARPRKDLPGHLELFARLGRLVPDARYVLAGPEGRERTRLMRLAERLGIADRASFPGFLADELLGGLLGRAALLLHVPLSEGFGFTPLEALEKGCLPCLSPRGALPEVCRQAALYLAGPRPEEALAGALSWERRRELLARGEGRLARFDPRAAAERLVRVCREVRSAPGGGVEGS